MAKGKGYTPKSKAAPVYVPGRTFQPPPFMKKGGQQPKAAPRSKTT